MAQFKQKNEIDELNTILRLIRIAQDLSTREVAEKMSVRTSYITDVERGDRKPSLKTIDKYCKALNISPTNLFLWREDQKKNKYPYRKLLMNLLQSIDELDERQQREEEKLLQLKNSLNTKSMVN